MNYSDPFGLAGCKLGENCWQAFVTWFTDAWSGRSAGKPITSAESWAEGREAVRGSGVFSAAKGAALGGALAARAESRFTLGPKIQGQMGKRGWTEEGIEATIADPARTAATTDIRFRPDGTRMSDPATAYINADGSYVVRNNRTRDIVQVSNRNNPNWKSPF